MSVSTIFHSFLGGLALVFVLILVFFFSDHSIMALGGVLGISDCGGYPANGADEAGDRRVEEISLRHDLATKYGK